ncbi:MAG: alpha-amylase, partial [Spirochaetales bacterium]|nr:alpha-amylase [Spirochaetales bacterium]
MKSKISYINTMKAIYNELKQIDPNIMVYGEPWTGGGSPVVSGVEKKNIDNCADTTADNGVGCFNDDYRNAIKGGEYGGFQQGHVQGKLNSSVHTGLLGTMSFTKKNARSLSYVECHDNYTLADKLAISLNGGDSPRGWKAYDNFSADQQTLLRNENKLAAAFVFLSQGTPFINGGQEFMRTKKGDENSYKSDDSINAIDMSFKEKFNDVYKTYKGLIAFRKANASLFVTPTQADADYATINGTRVKGLSYYILEGSSGNYKIYLNATDTEQAIDTTGYTKVIDVTSGTPTDGTTLPAKVGAKGFVILKK